MLEVSPRAFNMLISWLTNVFQLCRPFSSVFINKGYGMAYCSNESWKQHEIEKDLATRLARRSSTCRPAPVCDRLMLINFLCDEIDITKRFCNVPTHKFRWRRPKRQPAHLKVLPKQTEMFVKHRLPAYLSLNELRVCKLRLNCERSLTAAPHVEQHTVAKCYWHSCIFISK